MSEFLCNIWKVGHGSSAFLRTPNDRTILFDAGCSYDFSPAEHLVQSYGLDTNEKRLDWLIISHPDRDHIQDLPNIYNKIYPRIFIRNRNIPEEVLYPNGKTNLTDPLKTYNLIDEQIYIYPIADHYKNQPVSNWGGVLIEGFCCETLENCPDNKITNNMSLVSYIKFRDFEVVFSGDLEPLGWDALVDNTDISESVGKENLRVLVASHHGRSSGIRNNDNTIYKRFLDLMNPHIVIISDVRGNETTDADAYQSCLGHSVYSHNEKKLIPAKVLTTKTNNYVSLYQEQDGDPMIFVR